MGEGGGSGEWVPPVHALIYRHVFISGPLKLMPTLILLLLHVYYRFSNYVWSFENVSMSTNSRHLCIFPLCTSDLFFIRV